MDPTYIDRAYVSARMTCSQASELLTAHCWRCLLLEQRRWLDVKAGALPPWANEEDARFHKRLEVWTCGFCEELEHGTCFSLEGQFASIIRCAARMADENRNLMHKMANELIARCHPRFAWVKNVLVPRDISGSLRVQLEGPADACDRREETIAWARGIGAPPTGILATNEPVSSESE